MYGWFCRDSIDLVLREVILSTNSTIAATTLVLTIKEVMLREVMLDIITVERIQSFLERKLIDQSEGKTLKSDNTLIPVCPIILFNFSANSKPFFIIKSEESMCLSLPFTY